MPLDAPAHDGIPPWAIVSTKRRKHILRVAQLMTDWAQRLALPEGEVARWRLAALLHDAFRSAPVDVLESWTPDVDFQGAVELLHGPAAAAAALKYGTTTDAEVLDAVRWHTIGNPAWGNLGRALYCADYLEPGRKFHREIRGILAEHFPSEPASVLRQVAEWRKHFADEEHWDVPPETHTFWKSLGL